VCVGLLVQHLARIDTDEVSAEWEIPKENTGPVLIMRDTSVMLPPAPAPDTVTRHVPASEVVAAIYTAEIGVREKTGHNDGARVEEYLKAANLKKGDAWCAAFVTWAFEQAGVEAVVSGWSPDWFPAKHTLYKRGDSGNRTPHQADVFGIYFQDKGRIAHVGFVDRWESGSSSYAVTVEGNTNDAGSNEGDGVYRKRRLKSQVYKVSRWL
jgi:hypothetical protein